MDRAFPPPKKRRKDGYNKTHIVQFKERVKFTLSCLIAASVFGQSKSEFNDRIVKLITRNYQIQRSESIYVCSTFAPRTFFSLGKS